MYINNVDNIIKRPYSEIKMEKGSIVAGKILNNDNGSFELQLYDGTAIPVEISGNKNIADRSFNRFLIKDYNGNNFILIPIDDSKDTVLDNSIMDFFKSENIPENIGTDIINSLLKFNLPADNKNIITLYKNISFFDDIKNMSDSDIENLIKNSTAQSINHNSIEFNAGKEFFDILRNVNMDTISFFIENDIPINIKNFISFGEIASNKFYFNDLIDKLKDLSSNNTQNIVSENNPINNFSQEKIKDVLQNLYSSIASDSSLNAMENPKQANDIIKSFISELETNINNSDGDNIINKLISSKLTDSKSITTLYKNISFFNSIKNMDNSEIQNFINNTVTENINPEDFESNISKDIFNIIKNTDNGTLSILIKNDIPLDLKKLLSSGESTNKDLINMLKNISKDVQELKSLNFNIEENAVTSDLNNNSEVNLNQQQVKDLLQDLLTDTQNLKSILGNTDDIMNSNIDKNSVNNLNQDEIKNTLQSLYDNKSITTLYKNISFFNSIKNMDSTEIQNFINNIAAENINPEDFESNISKDIISIIKNADNGTLSTLIKNDIPLDLKKLLSSGEVTNKDLINMLKNISKDVQELKSLNSSIEENAVTSDLNNNSEVKLNQQQVKNVFQNLLADTQNLKPILGNTDDIMNPDIDKNSVNSLSQEKVKNILQNLLSNTQDLKSSYLDNANDIINSNINSNSMGNLNQEKIKDALQNLYDKLVNNIDGNNLKGVINKTESLKQTSDTVKSLISELANGTKHPSIIADKIINKLVLLKLIDSKNIVSLKDIFNSNNIDEKISKLNHDDINKLLNLSQLAKGIENNYNIYNFNYYTNNQCYKNNIIFKKHNKSKYINPSDVKFYINVKTNNIGEVESYVSKQYNDIKLTIKSEKKYMHVFKNSYKILFNNLLNLGYKLTEFNVYPIDTKINSNDIFNFFSDNTYKKLDVKV